MSDITAATVFEDSDGWHIRLFNSSAEVVAVDPVNWDGEGGFYNKGLDFVVSHLRGMAYKGSAAWEQNPDGSYSVVLHNPA